MITAVNTFADVSKHVRHERANTRVEALYNVSKSIMHALWCKAYTKFHFCNIVWSLMLAFLYDLNLIFLKFFSQEKFSLKKKYKEQKLQFYIVIWKRVEVPNQSFSLMRWIKLLNYKMVFQMPTESYIIMEIKYKKSKNNISKIMQGEL
jgi:hypothetical protein